MLTATPAHAGVFAHTAPAVDFMRTRISGLLASAAAAFFTFAFCTATLAAEGDPQPVPKLTARVMDLTGSISAADQAAIEARLKAFEDKKGAQIAVLIVPTVQPETTFDYASRVFTEWKLGRKGVDDGVLFVVAKNDRKMQILTGPGISGSLTDAMSKRIIAEVVAPKFRANDYAGGIDAGTQKMMAVIEGEALPPPPAKRQGSAPQQGVGWDTIAFIVLFLVFGVGSALRAMLGRFIGSSVTGAIAGIIAWFMVGGLLATAIFAIGGFLLALIGPAFTGGTRSRGGGWTTGGWSSGGGSWGGGGGSDGGFSGGGGGFDGGGASGDW
jgi:uncharacterized protein